MMPAGTYEVVELNTPITLFDGIPVQLPIVLEEVTHAKWPLVIVPLEPVASPD
jgi:hypothetical protein